MAELKLYVHNDPSNRQGFKTLLTGPEHPDYRPFCISAGHGIGFNDQKTIEVRDLIDGLLNDKPIYPDFYVGYHVSRVLEAIALSASTKSWINVSDI